MALSAELVCVLAVLLGAVWLVVRRYVAASPLDRVPGPTRSSAVLGARVVAVLSLRVC